MPSLIPDETCKVNRYMEMCLEEGTDLLDLDEVEFWEDICFCPACDPQVPADLAADPDFQNIAA